MRIPFCIPVYAFLIFFNLVNTIPATIKPNNFITNIQIKPTETLLFQAFSIDFKPNHFYKIMVHYLGSIGIEVKVYLICDRIVEMPSLILDSGNNNMKLNDYNELSFTTDEEGFPSGIWEDSSNIYGREKFLIEIRPKFIAYQMTDINNMMINLAVEIIESRYNTDNKPIGILTDKNLYLVLLGAILILIVLLFLLRHKVKIFLNNYIMMDSSTSTLTNSSHCHSNKSS